MYENRQQAAPQHIHGPNRPSAAASHLAATQARPQRVLHLSLLRVPCGRPLLLKYIKRLYQKISKYMKIDRKIYKKYTKYIQLIQTNTSRRARPARPGGARRTGLGRAAGRLRGYLAGGL